MGAAVAVALAAGVGTTGVSSNTTYKKPTQIIAAAKTTTLTDYHSNTEFTKSSDVKKIISTYGLKDSDETNWTFYGSITKIAVRRNIMRQISFPKLIVISTIQNIDI